MSFSSARLSGDRLHLQHGPIDLVIGADGARERAFAAAEAAFDGLLEALVDELDVLRQPLSADSAPHGPVARRMTQAVARHRGFVTPMASVAGAVADHMLAAMVAAGGLRRAYVNNGGDIALYLAANERFRLAMAGLDGAGLGAIEITPNQGIAGIATSGQGGRSLSFGIAESVTVLACDAAAADVAATLIANAVDLPDHGAISRAPATELRPDSDLGERLVVAHVGPLSDNDVDQALMRGAKAANTMRQAGLIHAAALFLRGQNRVVGPIGRVELKETEYA
ncbi:UPF0280 family protein [Rhodobacteraceae bacterium LMO-12]|nr:UPF0280 family protein [Rhodobacteraceae bacterium LMO-JJ12]